jgi:hypothetical protein
MKTLLGYLILAVMVLVSAMPTQAKGTFRKSQGQELHYREASTFSNKAEKRDIMVGVGYVSKSEQKRLLGNHDGKYSVLEVAITNNSRFRLYVNAIGFVDARDETEKRAASLDEVSKAMGPSGGGNKKGLQLSILRNNLAAADVRSRTVLPGETVQGLVFIQAKHIRNNTRLRVDIQNLKRLVYLDILVPIAP